MRSQGPEHTPKQTSRVRNSLLCAACAGDVEIPGDKAVPQEYNLDQLHGISYTKGCYLGQERQAHTHFRGVIRR